MKRFMLVLISSFLASGYFCRLLITFANSFDPDQNRQEIFKSCYMSQICSKMVIFLFQPILVAIFVTIATVDVESIPDFYTLAAVLINY